MFTKPGADVRAQQLSKVDNGQIFFGGGFGVALRLKDLCGCKNQFRISVGVRDAVGRQAIKPRITSNQLWVADMLANEDSTIELLALTGIGVEPRGFEGSGHDALPGARFVFGSMRDVFAQDLIDVDFSAVNEMGKSVLWIN